MGKYKFLIIVFLIAVLAISIASLFNLNVQVLYRIPFISIRWIDLAILIIFFSYLLDLLFSKAPIFKNRFIIRLCFVFLLFEVFQLAKSWKTDDLESQISHFLCTLSIFIIIDLSTYKIEKSKIIIFLKYLTILGSFALLISNTIMFLSFISGHAIFVDSGIRLGLSAEGIKETVDSWGLISFVYVFGLYFIQNKSKLWEKLLFIAAIISIFVSLVYSFSRGGLFTIVFITFIYIIVFSKRVTTAFINLFTIVLLIGVFNVIFGNILRQKGYIPIEKVIEIAKFAINTDNPDWDKGRSISRKYALNAWEKNFWTGVGYDNLSNYGLPEDTATAHNFVITSLFHRGIIGTFFYLLIIFLLYKNSVNLWFRTRKDHNYQSDMMKLLIIVSFFWLVRFWTQEIIWEKYSLSIQFLYLGLVNNYYKQQID